MANRDLVHRKDSVALLWLIPIFFTIHNLEEGLTFSRYMNALLARLPVFMQSLIPAITFEQFKIALISITVLAYVFILVYQFSHQKRPPLLLLLGTQMVVLINVFSHIGMAVLMRGYALGVVTALLVNLPFSIYLFRRALQEEWITQRNLVVLFLVGLVLHGPGLIALLRVSGWIAGVL
ncbi:MAG: HXXEE domain-containing protein [Anaerolineales bacterium]|nr:HXXEE domain-containing protein [Anaerolineales bacterium]